MDEVRDTRRKEMFRIDDEYLNGYARLCGINATGVYMALCRHADKEQKCFPSKKLIGEELAISERSVYTAIKTLQEWGIIQVEEQGRRADGSYKNLLYILLDKKHWKPKPSAGGAVGKSCRRQELQAPSANDDTHRRQLVPNKDTHIEGSTYKDTHPAVAGEALIVVNAFSEVNPSYRQFERSPLERAAAARLIEVHGLELVLERVKILPKTNRHPFLPTITSPRKLEERWADLEAGIEKQQAKHVTKKSNVAFS